MKKSSVIKVLALVLAAFSITAFAGCGNDDSSDSASSSPASAAVSTDSESTPVSGDSLVGVWEAKDYAGIAYTFNEDGSGQYDLMGNIMRLNYTTKDGKITIEFLEEGMSSVTLSYTLDGDTLDIKDSFGNDVYYVKK